MKAAIGCLIGLVFVVSASAEPLLEGRVRLDSGEPVADAQVQLFDLSDLRQGAIARAMTDGTGYFALPLSALTGRALPARFALGPNYPNPFNPSTIIPYQLAVSAAVRLEVFNLLGQHIATLVDGERPAGFHTATWHAVDGAGRAVGAGVYIYRMTVGVERQTGRMVLVDGQAGLASGGVASVVPGASGVGGANGEGAQEYGLVVSGRGLVPYVDSSFGVETGMAPVELVVSEGPYSAGKATDDACAFCDFFGGFGDAEDDETEEEESSETGEGDLIVSASVNDNILTTGQAFILRARMQNQGADESPELVLSYYRSSDATISTQDTQVGTDEVSSFAASIIRNESIRLTAPSTPGTYYYGACVASVSDGSDTLSSCSTGVSVIVEDDGADGQDEEFVFTNPQIYNDNVFVLPVEGNLAAGNLPYRDYTARFYEYFEDEFDFLIFISNIQEPDQGSLWPFAAYISVKNEVEGIGLDNFFDDGWESAGKLQGVIFFQYFGVWFDPLDTITSLGTLIHELMHRWANYIVPPFPPDPHWGFNSQHGWLGGPISELIDLGDGKFSIGRWPILHPGYSPIELYLAGFIPPENVPDLTIAEDGKLLLDEEGEWVIDDNGKFIITASGFKTYTIEDIIAEHGPRVPDHSQAQKDFRAAVILLVSEEFPVDPVILDVVSDEVSRLGQLVSLSEVIHDRLEMNFFASTGGRGTITMDDLSHFQRRASAKRLVPSSFGTPPPPIVDVGNDRENLGKTWRPVPAEEE